ncbi:hypothetical protein C8R43DRAFT_1118532 [Mycena crocata]|nr:hypothetical protein C8R43DRAFT_1118532 [Mycena crocata]
MYLCPNAAIKPIHVAAVLKNHGSSFLGNTKLGSDFFPPLHPNWNNSSYVVSPDSLPITSSNFVAVLFGTICSLPGAQDAGLLPGSRRFQALPLSPDSFRLRCPEWGSYGVDSRNVEVLYGKQTDSLLDAAEMDTFRDLDENWNPRIREWVVGNEIVVNFTTGGRQAQCIYTDPEGNWLETETAFPFAVNDSVILSATLRMDETHNTPFDCMRDYSVNALEIKRIRLIPLSTPSTLDDDGENVASDADACDGEDDVDELQDDDS